MPWTAKDAHNKTHRAKSPKSKKQWSKVANAILKRTGDDARAIRGANSAVKKAKRKKTRKPSR